MAEQSRLILCFHNHQPVGNFDFVIEDAYEKSYKPLLETVAQFPEIKVTFHYSGPLLDWLIEHKPEHIDLLKELAAKKQISILQGAYYEPIISNIPINDALDQISLYRNKLNSLFDNVSSGMWLAERVWEPHFPAILSKADIEFVPLDESHFQFAGIKKENVFGYYTTENVMNSVYTLPISKKLRYLMPFDSIENTINFIKENKGQLITMADDGEKFGLWPGTFNRVYEEKWLYKFFENISNSDEIKTLFFDDAIQSRTDYKGRIFIPSCSYPEMMEWSMSPNDIKFMHNLKDKLNSEEQLYVQSGFWSNFSVKYYEINIILKRMFEVSSNFNSFPPEEKVDLYKGQCNCPYWHGVFGGVYIPHLRHALFEHLIKQEKKHIIEGTMLKKHLDDINLDVIHKNKKYTVYLQSTGGAIFELDLYEIARNIQSIMARHYEYYHDLINMHDNSGVKTIHDGFYLKGDSVDLIYDNYFRNSLNDFIIKQDPLPRDLYNNSAIIEDLTKDEYKIDIDNNKICMTSKHMKKEVLFKENYLEINNISLPLNLMQQWNVAISSAKQKIISNGVNHTMNEIFSLETREFSIEDDVFNLSITFQFDKNIIVFFYPINSVSNSELGVESVFQGLSINILPYLGSYRVIL